MHIVYPLLDGKNEDIATFFDAFYNLVETNINKGSILIHCAAGISRVSMSPFRAPLLSSPILWSLEE